VPVRKAYSPGHGSSIALLHKSAAETGIFLRPPDNCQLGTANAEELGGGVISPAYHGVRSRDKTAPPLAG